MKTNSKTDSTTKYRIETERLNLVPVVDRDAEDVFSFTSNPNVTRWLTCETHRNIDHARTLIRNLNRPNSKYCTWAIRKRNTSRVIGLINFIRASNCQAEVHYMLAEEFWKQGLATEAVSSVVLYLKKFYSQIDKVVSDPVAINTGSCRVLEKCGFKRVNYRRVRWQKYFPKFVDVVCYELDISD